MRYFSGSHGPGSVRHSYRRRAPGGHSGRVCRRMGWRALPPVREPKQLPEKPQSARSRGRFYDLPPNGPRG